MKSAWALLGILALSPFVQSTLADEPPYLEFVRALREKRRAPDLALEYLQTLSKKPNLPKDLASFLPLEMAECRMDLAQLEMDPDIRMGIFRKAEEEFRAFLAAHANSPQAAGVNLHLARIVSQQGATQLSLAFRQDNKEARNAEKEKARIKFDQAAGSLNVAAAQIEEMLKKPDLNAADRKALLRDKRLAQFDMGVNLFYKANTFSDDANRSVTIAQARDFFKKVAAIGDKDSLYFENVAWLARCYAETDDPKNADAQFAEVLRQKGPESEPGKRLALYFRLRFMERDPNIKPEERPKRIETEATAWLDAYREYDSSQEGYAVRYMLAKAYSTQAQRVANQKSQEALNLYSKAEGLLDAVEHGDNDFVQEAHDLRMQIVFKKSSEISGGDIAKLANFQECFLRGQYEIFQLSEESEQARKAPPAKQKDLEGKRDKRLASIIEALSRALEFVDDQTSAKDQAEAQYLLSFAYLASDQPYPAAVLGEDLARRLPKSPRAVAAAGYALEAYSKILSEQEQKNAPKASLEGDRARVRSLAAFMEVNWPKNPITNLARYQLGLVAIKNNSYAEAVEVLARITPDYQAYSSSQYDLAIFAALPALRDKIAPPAGQNPTYFQDHAIAALRRITEPPADAPPELVRYYLLGKQQLATLLLGARQYDEMVQVSQQLQKQFKERAIDEKLRKAMEPAMETMAFLTQYAQAEIAYRTGQYDKVRTIVDPMLNDVAKQLGGIKDLEAKTQKEQDDFDAQLQQKIKNNQALKDDDQKKLEDYKEKVSRLGQQSHWKGQLLRSLLVLDLRSKVQEGNIQQAQQVFELLKNTSGYLEGGSTGVLLEIVQQLKAQIGELEAAATKEPAKKEELNKILTGFTTFLDKLGEQPANLSEDLIGFVANSYSGMKKHAKAANLLARIPAPKPSSGPSDEKQEDKDKREQEDRRKEAFYHHVRLMYVRELRLDKQFDRAAAEMKKIISEWGRNNLDAQREQIFILEDEEKYAAAANMWSKLMQEKLKPHVGKDNRLTDQYFDCYYHRVWCIYRFGMKQTDPAKKQDYVRRAANEILKLDSSKVTLADHVKKKFDDLLKQEEPLRRQYNALRQGEKSAQR
jgi:hypothetical protein